ncbi:MAG: hypothetical protein ACR2GA_04090 [Chloroflexota bacterium]
MLSLDFARRSNMDGEVIRCAGKDDRRQHLMRFALPSDATTRTTVDFDASILAELHRRAARERKSLGKLTSELLAQHLAGDSSDLERVDGGICDTGVIQRDRSRAFRRGQLERPDQIPGAIRR